MYSNEAKTKDQKYKTAMLYYMAHSRSARLELQKIFYDTVWYNRRDGGFMMAYNSGANLNQGKLIEFGKTKQIFENPKEELTENYMTGRFG